eukprot:CAMPEP_0118950330 /NCGR_PEP_ID=MMETSP1169-20130426/51200_1 /TAXON_ID=36882 /ORGANISM="Pyramimonas obovata, Strain CCMP722" /LENGTH=285 /DNA_ID=CAMNT_0006897145 /DNA_START=297 /DNA_END=1150 /DNA_ORIENTATION=-
MIDGDSGAATNSQAGSTQGDPVCSALSLSQGQITLTCCFRKRKRGAVGDGPSKQGTSNVEELQDDDPWDTTCTPPPVPQLLDQEPPQRCDSFGSRGIPLGPVTPPENDEWETWCKRTSLDPDILSGKARVKAAQPDPTISRGETWSINLRLAANQCVEVCTDDYVLVRRNEEPPVWVKVVGFMMALTSPLRGHPRAPLCTLRAKRLLRAEETVLAEPVQGGGLFVPEGDAAVVEDFDAFDIVKEPAEAEEVGVRCAYHPDTHDFVELSGPRAAPALDANRVAPGG